MFVMFLLTRVVTQEVLHKVVKNVIKNAKKFTLTSFFALMFYFLSFYVKCDKNVIIRGPTQIY